MGAGEDDTAVVTIEMNCDKEVPQEGCYLFQPHSYVQTQATHASFDIWAGLFENVTSACRYGDKPCLETAFKETSGLM